MTRHWYTPQSMQLLTWPSQVERFHPFDSTKFGKVVSNLVHRGVLKPSQVPVRARTLFSTAHHWSTMLNLKEQCTSSTRWHF